MFNYRTLTIILITVIDRVLIIVLSCQSYGLEKFILKKNHFYSFN